MSAEKWAEPDRVELGLRAATALYGENRGVVRQRLAAMGTPPPQPGWRIEYGTDGKASGMVWVKPKWEPDA